MATYDTIFALSSGRPPVAIAVVRICGPRAGGALQALAGRLPKPRSATLVEVRDPSTGTLVDEALALWFPAPHSETGEDTAELQLHGGRAIIQAVFRALGVLEGLRPAEPGEFARRAFENGRLDLTRVEGLADLIYADTEAQRRQALRQLKGLLGEKTEAWRRKMLKALALVEAQIDFADADDLPPNLLPAVLADAQQLLDDIEQTLADSGRGERLREGFVVAITGPPNAGKSSLINQLARRDAAIVSPFVGTTRDVIEVHLDLNGYPVTLLDTAGIRESDDPVEQEGIRRARARAATADLVLWIVDLTDPGHAGLQHVSREFSGVSKWIIANKQDIAGITEVDTLETRLKNLDYRYFLASAKTGHGLKQLSSALALAVEDFVGSTEPALITRVRQRHALQETAAALRRAQIEGPSGREDIVAEELRLATRALGRLTGRVDVEHVLDVIFREFCIGK